MLKQKLSKSTPTNTSLVRCALPDNQSGNKANCESPKLNIPEGRERALDVEPTFDNNSEVNPRKRKSGSILLNNVYVISINGNPLMPTTPRKARILLKEGKANVISRKPFTIKLTFETTNFTQPITLGLDPGYKHVGISAISNTKELYSGEFILRDDIKGLLQEKRMYRRNRRNKLWYRKPRFLNRGIKKGWLAPSIQHKLDSTLKIVDRIAKILPISKLIIEKAKFDIQKINNPTISGVGYSSGVQKDFENVKTYVRFRDGFQCSNCKVKNVPFHVHHIIHRSAGGTDVPDNLITLCLDCHDKVHSGEITVKIKKRKQFKAETYMNIVRNRMVERLKEKFEVEETFGYLTSFHRKEHGIVKSHINDAFCIDGGAEQQRCSELHYGQKRRNNRCLQIVQKGKKPSIRKERSKFQPNDLVKYLGKEYLVHGMNDKGRGIYLNDKNERTMKEKLHTNPKNVELVKYHSGIYLKLS